MMWFSNRLIAQLESATEAALGGQVADWQLQGNSRWQSLGGKLQQLCLHLQGTAQQEADRSRTLADQLAAQQLQLQ